MSNLNKTDKLFLSVIFKHMLWHLQLSVINIIAGQAKETLLSVPEQTAHIKMKIN